MPVDPFSFDPPSSHPGRAIDRIARSLLARLAGLDELRDTYASLPAGPDETFPARALSALGITTVVEHDSAKHIPPCGPLIVAANHPHGALDGLVLADAVQKVRQDVRLVANRVLARIPELRSVCFFVDPFEIPGAAARSMAGLRAAQAWLKDGGALILFPAGEVAHQRNTDATLRERVWSPTLGRLAAATGAAILPVFIAGENSPWFYRAGRIHSLLRTLMLGRELLNARGARITLRIGAPLDQFQDDSAHRVQGDRSRRVHRERSSRALGDGSSRVRGDRLCRVHGDRMYRVQGDPLCRVQGDPAYGGGITVRAQEAVGALAKPAATPVEEVRRLPPDARLITSNRFDVFHAHAQAIPITLQEIGRLRALTFQAVGEGTGSAMDLDRFDDHYVHLFVWDRERSCVVGAYRIGRTDRITAEHGIDGLYTRTLFRYGKALLDAMPPALELGRSFVRLEYQRDYQPLLLLWRGIGRFIVLHPQYRCLFGPVSISARYSDASQAAIMAFLERHHRHASLARLVEPLNGKSALVTAIPLSTVAAVDQHVAALEADGKGIPVLLRQYLKLGAKLLGISEDSSFGNVTDALMAVDLAAVSAPMLRRYLGDDGVALYSSRHSGPRLTPAA